MTIRRHWRFPEGIFTGPDWTPERRAMEDLSKALNFPLVGMRRETNQAIGAVAVAPLAFPITLADEYSLYRSTNIVQVPQDWSHYLVVGVAGMQTDGAAATGRRAFGWQLNTITTSFHTAVHCTGGSVVSLEAPIMKWVQKGDSLRLFVSAHAAETLTTAEFWLMFIPVN